MIDLVALWMGYGVLLVGGTALFVFGAWGGIEMIVKRAGWTRLFIKWAYDNERKKRRQ